MAGNPINESRKRVLVFNPLKRLVAIFQSVTSAAGALGKAPINIYEACTGKSISSCSLYFRYLYEDKIEIDTLEDLGTLKLEDYDKLMGLERKYYATKDMTRTGMKYKTKKNKK